MLKNSHIQPLTTIQVKVAHASVASSKPKVEIDSHTGTCVVGDNCLFIHNHNRPVKIHSCGPNYCHSSAKTVDAAVGYQELQSNQKLILMINQAICINGIVNHLLYPMQCPLNGVNITEVPKFLADSPSVTTHALELPIDNPAASKCNDHLF